MTTLVQDWFRIWEDRPSTWVIEEPLHSEEVKSYLIVGSQRALLLDTGMGVADIRAAVEDITDLPIVVVQSHAHVDHIGGAWQFEDVSIHPAEAEALAEGVSAEELNGMFDERAMNGALPEGFQSDGFAIPGKAPTRLLADGDEIDVGDRSLDVIFAPGHSAGGIVLLDREDRSLFSTDVVYLRSLYLLNEDSSLADYARTLERLIPLLPEVDRLYPSHGPTPLKPGVIPLMLDAMRSIMKGAQSSGLANADFGLPETAATQIHRFIFGDFDVLVDSLNLADF
jgi:glyoxylase-like metal-dependent hydrolase (beta-lactamase superfamily II)